jgi:hypothetical protein
MVTSTFDTSYSLRISVSRGYFGLVFVRQVFGQNLCRLFDADGPVVFEQADELAREGAQRLLLGVFLGEPVAVAEVFVDVRLEVAFGGRVVGDVVGIHDLFIADYSLEFALHAVHAVPGVVAFADALDELEAGEEVDEVVDLALFYFCGQQFVRSFSER